ncbi:CBO0543 family protein [Anaerobacillus sp. MEB173]|uniref:CBO0543 family protein n=1 Tax=Anaerobacillus sp. MEB173 TaxID=3383345 RepID=UPI003F8F875F
MMLILIYSTIAILFFLMWRKRIDFRHYYSTLLTISYLRFLEQFILVHILEVWEYDNLPLPVASTIGAPILLNITFFPLLAYFFIKYIPKSRLKILVYYFLWAFILLGVETSLIWTNYLEHKKEWNYLFSYYLAFSTFVVVHWQYKLFLTTGWYPIKTEKTQL